jgi:hypothetical protein
MPNTLGTDVTTNYLRTKPSTRFSTRDLAFASITGVTGIESDAGLSNSLFSRVVRSVQTQAEIYAVGTPASGAVIIVVAIDTANDGDNTDTGAYRTNEMATTIQQALSNAGISATVAFKRLSGAGFATQDMDGYGTGGETYVTP